MSNDKNKYKLKYKTKYRYKYKSNYDDLILIFCRDDNHFVNITNFSDDELKKNHRPICNECKEKHELSSWGNNMQILCKNCNKMTNISTFSNYRINSSKVCNDCYSKIIGINQVKNLDIFESKIAYDNIINKYLDKKNN